MFESEGGAHNLSIFIFHHLLFSFTLSLKTVLPFQTSVLKELHCFVDFTVRLHVMFWCTMRRPDCGLKKNYNGFSFD
uniref:Uncharacterized protein n=1 Tax=Anguilla anguilla TaxID=7936 RepID=A0A0E9X4X9_ANGAN